MSRSPIQRIDQTLFNALAAEAAQRPRKRCNHNFHKEAEPVQRFLKVLQPGTYVRPHRHVRDVAEAGFECFLVLQGAIGLMILSAEGEVHQQETISASGPIRGVEVAAGQFHTLVALEYDSVIFELKQGPYVPCQDKDFIRNFPQEGTPEAEQQERRWRDRFIQAGYKNLEASTAQPTQPTPAITRLHP
ncbi:WbuC family cupin fold metalloprotein [Synechococcus sp. A10-1-5-9]|uniref:WbuC family cupin fold metalloprotein n=1 Tax=Synechococcus sp. A10-1-5-9 TaxID=3392295 RepID=UPI0039ECB5E0